MENNKQKIADDFDRFQSLQTEEERQTFWDGVEKWSSDLRSEQRLTAQAGVRESIDQILHRMEAIKDKLTAAEVV